jgi:phosphatidylserine/phosphatidylglycerophosphate/cardiolipin synthase-like enzyme
MLGKNGAFDTLVERAKAGVDVRVILDGGKKRAANTSAFDALTAAGVKVKWSDPKFAFMHAKAFVVDDRVAVVSTGNFPKSLILDERNYVARDEDPQDVKSLAAIFDADWNGSDAAPAISCTRLLVSPVNSRERVIDLVNAAKSSVLVESLELSDPTVVDALIERKKAGLDVRVILADPSWSGMASNAKSAAKLDLAGIDTRTVADKHMLVHVKSIIVDGKSAYMGSENLTIGSFTRNREIGLIVSDAPVLTTMTSTFEADFASGPKI